jgi:hypothetical protein
VFPLLRKAFLAGIYGDELNEGLQANLNGDIIDVYLTFQEESPTVGS